MIDRDAIRFALGWASGSRDDLEEPLRQLAKDEQFLDEFCKGLDVFMGAEDE
jgi:hypothetical protein